MRKRRELENFIIGVAPSPASRASRRQLIESRHDAIVQHVQPPQIPLREPDPEFIPGREPVEPVAEQRVVIARQQQQQKRRG